LKTPVCPCSSGCIFREADDKFHIKHVRGDICIIEKHFDHETNAYVMMFTIEIEGYGRLVVTMDAMKACQMAFRVGEMGRKHPGRTEYFYPW